MLNLLLFNLRTNEIRCEVDIHLSVTVSSDSSVSVTPRIHCKNSENLDSTNETKQNNSKKKRKEGHQRTNSDPGTERSKYDSTC